MKERVEGKEWISLHEREKKMEEEGQGEFWKR